LEVAFIGALWHGGMIAKSWTTRIGAGMGYPQWARILCTSGICSSVGSQYVLRLRNTRRDGQEPLDF
jgi:hypothetical protein